ncbi:MAG: hypothetical protein EP329_06835 [Deltaproteobacteria bacterium]|nr:MAG: hypothetical protein EP329_06835 [Deltaproteobacteria bacterium]
MATSFTHIRHQGPVLRALGRTAVEALRQRVGRPSPDQGIPGPELHETLPPRPADLVRAYVRAVGGEPDAYRDTVPAHFFSQWTFPLLSKTLVGLPYPLARVLNGGCHLVVNGPIPAGEPLEVTAQLTDIDDDGQRAILHQRVVTGPRSQPDALVVDFHPIVPLGKKGGDKKKVKPTVPEGARELERWRLVRRDALDFAILTGDFNPIHWIPLAARAAGFKSTILHGFATMAFAVEGMTRHLWDGDPSRLAELKVRFRRPLTLPREVGTYVDDVGRVFVGDAPGGPVYLSGTFRTRG